MRERFTLGTVIASLAVLAAFVAAWQYLPPALGIPGFMMPGPKAVWSEFVRMHELERPWLHTGVTTLEIVVSFLIGSTLGAVIGYILAVLPKVELVLSPYILGLQIAPKVAFAPLLVLWMGYTLYPRIVVAVLIVFFPIMINVLTAIRSMDPDLISLARGLSATRWQIFRTVEYPATLPSLFSGLRIASTLCVIGVIVGEFVGGNLGLGYLLIFGQGMGNTAMVFAVTVMLTIIGILAYAAVVLVEMKVLHYLPRAQHHTV